MFLNVLTFVFFFKQKTAYVMRISDWSSDVCSSDLGPCDLDHLGCGGNQPAQHSLVLTHPFGQTAVFQLNLIQVECAAHDQTQCLNIDRLLVDRKSVV